MQAPVCAESHAGSKSADSSSNLGEAAKERTRSRSRENTPSTQSSHSLDTAPLDRAMSTASVEVSSGSSLGQSRQDNCEDVDKFLRKVEMEKVCTGGSWRKLAADKCRKCKLFSSD